MTYQSRKTTGREPITVTPSPVPTVVPNPNIASDAITSEKIKDAEIQSEDIGLQAVETKNIQDGAITQYKIGPAAINNQHIGPKAVGRGKIADGAVDTNALANYAVTTPKIAPGAITQSKLGADVGANILGVESVLTVHIKDSNVTAAKLAVDAVTSGKISSGAVGNSELANNAVTNDKILDGEIAPVKLAAGFGIYVPRRVTAADFTETDFTFDAALHPDGLDLSAIVPAGAIAVLIAMGGIMASGTPYFKLQTNQADAIENIGSITLTAGWPAGGVGVVLPIDADRLLDYYGIGVFNSLSVYIVGYVI